MKKIVLLCVFAGVLSASSVESGVKSLKKGNYQSALTNFKQAAMQGDKIAQRNLGVMYHNGLGVAQDRYKASYWFNMADGQTESYDRVSFRD